DVLNRVMTPNTNVQIGDSEHEMHARQSDSDARLLTNIDRLLQLAGSSARRSRPLDTRSAVERHKMLRDKYAAALAGTATLSQHEISQLIADLMDDTTALLHDSLSPADVLANSPEVRQLTYQAYQQLVGATGNLIGVADRNAGRAVSNLGTSVIN